MLDDGISFTSLQISGFIIPQCWARVKKTSFLHIPAKAAGIQPHEKAFCRGLLKSKNSSFNFSCPL